MYKMGRTDAHEGIPKPKVVKKTRRKKRKGKLVIVESPAKARTVGNFLGKGYTVKASVGHVRDLLRSQLSVDVENGYTPKYRVPNDKRPVVKELKQLAKEAAEIYLATDPDREGEAIAWHLCESVEIDPEVSQRVVFHEITEPAIAEAFGEPREINMDLVNAQQARRILDRLVGYNLSPLLWRKVRSRLSAGRVQSIALRLIVEREREIEDFIPEEYWSIKAEFEPAGTEDTFIAKLIRLNKDEVVLGKEEQVKPILADMEHADYRITRIKRGERKRRPRPPFITSTLQQAASRRLGYSARRTMALAQQLYEGIDVGNGGLVGLITYMRSDSTNVSPVAQKEAAKFIAAEYGEDYLPKKPPVYSKKTRGAQEAHEAIRPTSVMRVPKNIRSHLNKHQLRLYRLIWQRFVASQMAAAIYDTQTVDVTGTSASREYLLRATGRTVRFQGFMKVYEEKRIEEREAAEAEHVKIPRSLKEDQVQKLLQLLPEQHFTQPPPRYSEATLVRALEENGIGRPSTYAPILGTIQQRGYVYQENRRLFPTDTGILVNDLLVEYFPDVIEVGFTARMESDLDQIAAGEEEWAEVINRFYDPFEKDLKVADEKIPEMKVELEPIGRACPRCEHDLVIRWGRYGKFISCSNFPECRHTEPWLEKIGVACPLDGGDVVERKTRKNRTFYGCSNYPECEFTSWKKPLSVPCPNCSGLLVVANKNYAQCTKCEEQVLLDELTIEEIPDS
jgi:DNA topoisomerase-1